MIHNHRPFLFKAIHNYYVRRKHYKDRWSKGKQPEEHLFRDPKKEDYRFYRRLGFGQVVTGFGYDCCLFAART